MFANGTNASSGATPITVVLADDHSILREGLRLLLESPGGIKVVGEAENGLQAVEKVKELRPNVVVLDLAMPVLNGKEAARAIVKEVPETKVVMLSTYADDHHVQQLIEIGVRGYLVKQAAATEIIQAVREVTRGNRFFSPVIAKRLSAQAQQSMAAHGTSKPGKVAAELTPREAQVLQLIAEGHPNKGIASILGISIKTVEKHRQQVMNKLNLHDIAGLTRHAIAQGMIEPRTFEAPPST